MFKSNKYICLYIFLTKMCDNMWQNMTIAYNSRERQMELKCSEGVA